LVQIADGGVELLVALLVLSAFGRVAVGASVGFMLRGERAVSLEEDASIHQASVSGPSRRMNVRRIESFSAGDQSQLALHVFMDDALHVIRVHQIKHS